ncbi:uncharacterized protein [Notamacropus eugenii]|uniref:uncharacterized protein n=1 Tax=Notamacropus eugenii TaxID=9315 RepID=UPI003B683EC5
MGRRRRGSGELLPPPAPPQTPIHSHIAIAAASAGAGTSSGRPAGSGWPAGCRLGAARAAAPARPEGGWSAPPQAPAPGLARAHRWVGAPGPRAPLLGGCAGGPAAPGRPLRCCAPALRARLPLRSGCPAASPPRLLPLAANELLLLLLVSNLLIIYNQPPSSSFPSLPLPGRPPPGPSPRLPRRRRRASPSLGLFSSPLASGLSPRLWSLARQAAVSAAGSAHAPLLGRPGCLLGHPLGGPLGSPPPRLLFLSLGFLLQLHRSSSQCSRLAPRRAALLLLLLFLLRRLQQQQQQKQQKQQPQLLKRARAEPD